MLAEWLTQLVDELQEIPWQEVPEVSTPTAAQFTSGLSESVDELAAPGEGET